MGAARDDNTAGGVRFSVCVVEVSPPPGAQAVLMVCTALETHAAHLLGCSLLLLRRQAQLCSRVTLLVYTMLQTVAGPVALPPTEHTSYDVEVDIREAYLDLHRHIYRFQVSMLAASR